MTSTSYDTGSVETSTDWFDKINFDRAIFSKVKNSRIGVMLRNNQGLVMASLSQQLSQACSLVEIVALAASTALQFASNLGINQAVLERNSQVLMTALINDSAISSSHGLLIDHVRFGTKLFTRLRYSHVKRESNTVAHNLAVDTRFYTNNLIKEDG